MFYYLYQITNNINGKIYVGVHKTKYIDDGYMGSGKGINAAIKKYGIKSFSKVILETFDNKKSMYLREAEIVTLDFIKRKDVYNLACGGTGGTIEQNRKPFNRNHSQKTKDKISDSRKGLIVSGETKLKIKKNLYKTRSPEKMREDNIRAASLPKSEEHKKNIAKSMMGRIGILSPSFGIKRKLVKCSHCNKEGSMNTLSRWHFDNCKYI